MATIMIYPNKQDFQGFRVQDKVLNRQYYFTLRQFDNDPIKAANAARQMCEKLNKQRAAIAAQDINQIFYPDGRVIGLSHRLKNVNDRGNPKVVNMLSAQITVDKKQIRFERRLGDANGFYEAYEQAQEWILKKRGIKRTEQITQLFKDAQHRYRKPQK